MKPKPAFIVLVASESNWETFGPVAAEYATRQEAEAAARELSARYPNRVLGVYELRSVFGTEQVVVKRSVGAARTRRADPPPAAVRNIFKIRASN